MALVPNTENVWYQKVLGNIKNLDEERKSMEHDFNPNSIGTYEDVIRQETKAAAELLKLGAEFKTSSDMVTITVSDDSFSVPKDQMREELGVDQYNLLINHGEEEQDVDKDDDIPGRDTGPHISNSDTVTTPDGTVIPKAMAPFVMMQQAMNQVMSAYTGTPVTNQPALTGKARSKTLSEILKNISELQQQVITIEDEKNKAVSISMQGSKKDKDRIAELEAAVSEKDKELEAVKAELDKVKTELEQTKGQLENIRTSSEEKITRWKDKLNKKDEIIAEKNNAAKEASDKIASLQQQVNNLSEKQITPEDHNKIEQYGKLQEEKNALQEQKSSLEKQVQSKDDKIGNLIKEKSNLEDRVFTDHLTGVGNESALNRDLDERKDDQLNIARIGICGMKDINKDNGRAMGDKVIGKVADYLQNAFGRNSVYRLYGDQFAVIGSPSLELGKNLTEIKDKIAESNIFIAYGVSGRDNASGPDNRKLYDIAAERMDNMRDKIYETELGGEEEELESEEVEAASEPEKDSDRDSDDLESDELLSEDLMSSIDDERG